VQRRRREDSTEVTEQLQADPPWPQLRPGELVRIEQDRDGGIRVAGDIDMSTAQVLSERLHAALRPGATLVVDLREVRVLQSHGVAVLFEITDLTALRVRIRAGSAVASVTRIAGLDAVAKVEQTPPEETDERPTAGG
jgi:anti-anti-sigma factor